MSYRTIQEAILCVVLGAFPFLMSEGRAASRDEQSHACRADAFRYCSADIPNEEKITACMKQHYAQLMPACRAMFDAPASGARPNRQWRSEGRAQGRRLSDT
jgi:hypothetical protein